MTDDDVFRRPAQAPDVLLHNLLHCRTCGGRLDAAAEPGTLTPKAPTSGDVAVCFRCGVPSVYEVGPLGVALRAPTHDEQARVGRRPAGCRHSGAADRILEQTRRNPMIKALITQPDGRPAVLLGLSRANMRLLLAGKPIKVDGRVLGVDVDVCLVGGETEQDIRQELVTALGAPARQYTCCEEHAALAGMPHQPHPDQGPGDPHIPDPATLPDV